MGVGVAAWRVEREPNHHAAVGKNEPTDKPNHQACTPGNATLRICGWCASLRDRLANRQGSRLRWSTAVLPEQVNWALAANSLLCVRRNGASRGGHQQPPATVKQRRTKT